eukprot:124121-Hanusia_phi.AAC.3
MHFAKLAPPALNEVNSYSPASSDTVSPTVTPRSPLSLSAASCPRACPRLTAINGTRPRRVGTVAQFGGEVNRANCRALPDSAPRGRPGCQVSLFTLRPVIGPSSRSP